MHFRELLRLQRDSMSQTFLGKKDILDDGSDDSEALLGSGRRNSQSDVGGNLLQLPHPLHGKVSVSQSLLYLKTVRRIRWACREISSDVCLKPAEVLANVLQDYHICPRCRGLHMVDPSDLPYSDGDRHNYRCVARWKMDSHEFGINYTLTYHHVHLALKYSRTKNDHEEHLARLLKPVKVVDPDYDNGNLTVEFFARPKIIEDRFFLFSAWDLKCNSAAISMETVPLLRFCPHLTFLPSRHKVTPRNFLVAAVHMAFETPGQEVYTACQRCPTDYAVSVSQNHLVIGIWQDLGRGKSSRHWDWRIHIRDADNSLLFGPTIHHAPGRILNAYVNEDKKERLNEGTGECESEAELRKESSEDRGKF